MNNEERKRKTFEIFYYSSGDKEKIKELEELITLNKHFDNLKYTAMLDGKHANIMYHAINDNRNKYSELMHYYDILLKSMNMLARELNINNSLELSIFFSYLLWNGYLSKNKKYRFCSDNLKKVVGLWFADIMNGTGVCLNNSDMLRDFLYMNNFNSTILSNHLHSFNKIDYSVPIVTKSISKEQNIFDNIVSSVINFRKANHAFNLIEDNSQLYIYDSTNLELFNVTGAYRVKLVNGYGKSDLFPYKSYRLCFNIEQSRLLDKLFDSDFYSSPYNRDDLKNSSRSTITLLNYNKILLDYFYDEVRPYIRGISNELDKIKVKKK